MSTLPSPAASDAVPSFASARSDTIQYNHSPSTDDAAADVPQIRFPSSLPKSRPTISTSSSTSSSLSASSLNPSFVSSEVRASPTTPPPNRSNRFRIPRFSLWGRSTPDTLLDDSVSDLPPPSDIATDLDTLHLSQPPALSSVTSTSDPHDQRLDPEAISPSQPSSSSVTDASMPMLVINEPVSPSPVSSPKLGSIWRLGGGRFASPVRKPEARRGRPATADSTVPRDSAYPPSQFAAWSELMRGPPPPDRSTTFSSISSASCSSYTRPCMKKVSSHDSIRSFASSRPVDSDTTTSHHYSTIPIPKVIKTKLRSKAKPGQEVDFDNVFLAQELCASSSSSKNAAMAKSPSRAQNDFATTLSGEKRPKRSSWAARRSTSPQAVSNAQISNVRSSSEQHDTECQHAQRGRIDRQLSTCSYLTTTSTATTSSSDAGEALPPRSPRLNGELELHAGSNSKPTKAAASKRKTYALQFSLDGRYLAAAGSDHLIRVYEVISSPADRADEIELAQMQRVKEACHRKSCSQGAGALVRGNAKSDVRAVPPELAPIFKSTPVHVFAGHTGDVLDLSWSKNNFLLSCSSDKTARLWHPNRSDCLCTFTTSAVVSSLDFHPVDDRFFVTGGLDGKLRLWNISARRVQSINDVPGVITAVAFSASGGAVCVGTHSGSVLTFECTHTLGYVGAVTVKSAKASQASKITSIQPVQLASESSDKAEYMTITSNDSRVRIYSISPRRLVSRFKSTSYVNRTSQIRATVSSDSQHIVSGSEDASIHIWSVGSTAPLLANLFGGIKRNKSILKHSDDGDSSTWRSWHAGSGSVRCAVFAPQATAELLALAHDPIAKGSGRARIVVSTDDSNSIRVWRSDPSSHLF